MTDALVVMLLLVVFVACIGMGGESLKATIDQTSVSLYAGICITDWRRLLVVGEPGHWGGVNGLSSVGPWSHGKRWCDGGHRVNVTARPCTDCLGEPQDLRN